MTSLFSSTEFWAGAFLLCAFQVGKFSELNQLDDDLKNRSAIVPNLRASDFLGHTPYLGTLALFLLATFIGYTLMCLASPSLIEGWMRVVGTADAQAITKGIAGNSYPLWIAAAFMGLAHQAIPGFSNVANVQRDIFHDLVGIPRDVIVASSAFSTQILAQASDKALLGPRVAELCSDRWRVKMERYADTRFFRDELERLNLDGDALDDVLAGSYRELRTRLEQLVYVACIATVRRRGGRALAELAGDLGVAVPTRRRQSVRDLMGPALGCAVALTVLLFLIPMFDQLVARLLPVPLTFWPTGDNALADCAVYLGSQVLPVLFAVAILAIFALARSDRSRKGPGETSLFENAGTYFAIIFVVVLCDYLQILWDYGSRNFEPGGSPVDFFIRWLPYNLLHSLIALAICMFIHWRFCRSAPDSGSPGIEQAFGAMGIAVVASAFYAMARLKYQFGKPEALDFLLMIVILNAAAAAIAFVAYRSVWRRRWRNPDPGAE
jgi:hypothetical protein